MRGVAFFAVMALTATASFADGANLGLLDAYQRGRIQDPRLAAADAQFRSEREAYPSALAGLLPFASVSGAYARTDTHNFSNLYENARNYDWYRYGATINQTLYRKDKIEGYGQAKVLEAQAALRLEAATQDFILRIAQAYVDVLLAQDNLELSRIEKSANEGQRQRAKRAFEVGTATVTDVSDAQARYDLTVAREINAVNNVEVAKENLARIIGLGSFALTTLSSDIPLMPPQPADVDYWIKKAVSANLQLRIADLGVDVAAYEVERIKGQAYPSLDLVANYGVSNQANNSAGLAIDNAQADIQLQLNMPLYSGGLATSRLRAVRADKERVAQMREDARRQTVALAQQAYLNVANGMEQVRALQQAVVSSQGSLDATQRGLEVGLRTALDVLNAQQQLFTAKRDLANARYQYLMGQLRLQYAVGELSEHDLQAMDKWFVRRAE